MNNCAVSYSRDRKERHEIWILSVWNSCKMWHCCITDTVYRLDGCSCSCGTCMYNSYNSVLSCRRDDLKFPLRMHFMLLINGLFENNGMPEISNGLKRDMDGPVVLKEKKYWKYWKSISDLGKF